MTRYERTEEISQRLGRGGVVTLRTVDGDIRVRTTDEMEARVRANYRIDAIDDADAERLWQAARVTVAGDDRHFAVESNAALEADLVTVDLEATIPADAALRVLTVSGDVSATGCTGEQTYQTVSGDLSLDQSSGPVRAQTVSGDVRLHGERELRPHVTTTSGDAAIAAALIHELRVVSVSGDVIVGGTLAPDETHRVETVSGDLVARLAGGVSLEATGSSAGMDAAGGGRRVLGDGSARLVYRSVSGEARVTAATGDDVRSEPPADLAVLRDLERGTIDVDEAARRLAEVDR